MIRDWMLYLVAEQRAQTPTAVVAQTRQALDFSHHPVLRELGLDGWPATGRCV